MTNLLALAAPIALILPMAGGQIVGSQDSSNVQLGPGQTQSITQSDQVIAPAAVQPPTVRQARIEQRLIIRISPRSSRQRNNLLADLPQRAPSTKMVERKVGKCVPLKDIAAFQTGSGNKLVLYMRDRRVMTLNLEKSCRSRDFYSGFYVEPRKDGKLCVDRDELQSRSGAKCEVDRMRQLVAVSK